ncbi:SRPBCC family protein [uncultured Ruegeria sp.]|uniref:SRPBCC family protein n=1 Tax=uncultured Ruegeria sp. TaxID=259304 RepID=UPI002632C396|nr:SRPBCC family protein [uncultured Ruegeria sp.]
MQFSAQEDIEVPIDTVFTMVSDFERFERMALRRGIDVRRVSGSALPQAGTTWETEFKIRGKPRQITVEMTEFERPSLMRFQSSSKGMNGDTVVELLALSQRRTRFLVETSMGAKTLPARLLLQSLKLGQSRFRRQFQTRLSEFARELEERHLHGV